jgi:GNAT superfamily N-acetyltransferase
MRIDHEGENVSWARVADLFEAVGWGQRDPHEIREAFAKSSIKAFAFEGDELIGFGRTIDDGRYYATIVDVVVAPSHQRKGVGRAIMEDLHSRLKGFLVVTLTATPQVQPFYQRLGWRNQTTAMIRPRSPEQEKLNC